MCAILSCPPIIEMSETISACRLQDRLHQRRCALAYPSRVETMLPTASTMKGCMLSDFLCQRHAVRCTPRQYTSYHTSRHCDNHAYAKSSTSLTYSGSSGDIWKKNGSSTAPPLKPNDHRINDSWLNPQDTVPLLHRNAMRVEKRPP